MPELTTKFESLEAGDQIVVPQYAKPLTVVEVLDSVGIVELEGQRGGEKSLVQNKNNPESISLMAGADKKGMVSEFEIVHKENTEDDDEDETETASKETYEMADGTPKKTGADLFESVARVLIHDTATDNETVRITVEHPGHAGGVHSWLRYSPETVGEAIESHLENMVQADVTRVDVIDDAGVGVTEQTITGENTDVGAEASIA